MEEKDISLEYLPSFINAAVAETPPTTFEFNAAGDALRRLPSLEWTKVATHVGSKQSASSDFELVHLHEIRDSIVSKYLAPAFAESASGSKAPSTDDEMVTQVIHDWIVLWFLVGNDFLPHLPSVTLDDSGTKKEFESILKWHIESLRSESRLTIGDTLNVPGLLSLFQKLSEDEAATFQRYHKGHHSTMLFGDPSKPETRVDRVKLHQPGYSDR
jgi:5'-3' exonuclease